jgi:hypothetical protein
MKRNLEFLIAVFFGVSVIAACATPTLHPTEMNVPPEVSSLIPEPGIIIGARLFLARLLLIESDDPKVHSLNLFMCTYQIKIYIDPRLDGDVMAIYNNHCLFTYPPIYTGIGEIVISEKFINKAEPMAVASVLVHESIHAQQNEISKHCDCTVKGEFEADSGQISFLFNAGRSDLAKKYFGPEIIYASGYFDKNKLWQAIEKSYPECSDSGNPYTTKAMPSPVSAP